MTGDKFLTGEEMSIKLRQLNDCTNLYYYHLRPVPTNICEEGKELIDSLEQTRIIKKMTKKTDTCTPASFVKKNFGGLHFVIDFTTLNRSVIKPMHSILSSDQISAQIERREAWRRQLRKTEIT